MRVKWLVALWLLLNSCHSESSEQENREVQSGTDSLEAVQEEPLRRSTQPSSDSASFKAAFRNFFTALHASDTATLNQFVHPELGLWIIEQPGALPKMTKVTDITAFKREYQNRSFFTIQEEVKACDLQEEAWPSFDCADMNYEAGKSGYSKNGCFVWRSDKFRESGYWDYAGLQPEQIKSIKSALPFVQRSVLHTATSFEFHFGYVDGHWRLLFTKLIYPCSA